MMTSTFEAPLLYTHPAEQPRSSDYALWVNGSRVDTLLAEKADFAAFACVEPVDLVVKCDGPAEGATVRPLSAGVVAAVSGDTLRFRLKGPAKLCVDVPGRKPLFIYADAPDPAPPSRDDPGVRYFEAGRLHDLGMLELKSGETLYLEPGAVLRANIRCTDATDVSIRGRGIIDGSCCDFGKGQRVRSVIFDRCERVRVEGVIMIEPTSWMLVLSRCRHVSVDGIKQIGSVMSSDGIDVCGSKHVRIENCCLRNEDDNIAIKSVAIPGGANWAGDVEDVRVRRCVFLNGAPGNVMEIGYELRAETVRDIVFEDIDVIYAHGEGAVFSIHNGDRAVVENVRWENIRVEHYWDKLLDIRVVRSRYSHDQKRGRVRGVHLKNIRVAHATFNEGCSVSLISGYKGSEPVERVVIEDFYLGDEKIVDADGLSLHLRNVTGLEFH